MLSYYCTDDVPAPPVSLVVPSSPSVMPTNLMYGDHLATVTLSGWGGGAEVYDARTQQFRRAPSGLAPGRWTVLKAR